MKNKIIITGVTGGVGEALARFFISNDWIVIGLARDVEKLKLLNDSINSEYFHYFLTDIRTLKSVEETFTNIYNLFGTIDVLVNNAAIFKTKKFNDFSSEEINDIIDTNLKGTIFCTLECLKIMETGRIININSVSGTHGIENQAVYSATKYGINGFSESLNQEIIKKGISISTIFPGGIDTQLWNEKNPYPGNVNDLLKTSDIVDLIYYISKLSGNVILKNVTLFPACEWH